MSKESSRYVGFKIRHHHHLVESRTRLLDLGGGPGTYAIHFCMHNPGLTAVVYDLATTQPFAEKIIKRFGMEDRVEFVHRDYPGDPANNRFCFRFAKKSRGLF